MTTIKDIYNYINEIAPYELQESYDNSGLCIGNGRTEVKKALIALDVTKDIILEAVQCGADTIITHHPVIFKALKTIDTDTVVGMLLANGICSISAHTNFDSSLMNDLLCKQLEMIPVEHITENGGAPIGCICALEKEMTAKELAKHIQSCLGNVVVRYNDLSMTQSYADKKISRAAVCSGSGGSFWRDALAKGCDALITGDVKHDIFIDANNSGLCVFDAGHFHTENIFCEYMKSELHEQFRDVEFLVAKNNKDIVSYKV